jgi:hypothetical protein
MKGVATNIMQNGIWLTLPPLVFSLYLMSVSPTALTPAEFDKDVPRLLIYCEIALRFMVFAMPAFFSVGVATKTQQRGFILYISGLLIYFLSYGTQNYLPNSAWSASIIGFTASAWTNLIWMTGIGLMGKELFILKYPPYRPALYIAPATLFIILHVTHAIIYFRSTY